jgi:hypothetical protein
MCIMENVSFFPHIADYSVISHLRLLETIPDTFFVTDANGQFRWFHDRNYVHRLLLRITIQTEI